MWLLGQCSRGAVSSVFGARQPGLVSAAWAPSSARALGPSRRPVRPVQLAQAPARLPGVSEGGRFRPLPLSLGSLEHEFGGLHIGVFGHGSADPSV